MHALGTGYAFMGGAEGTQCNMCRLFVDNIKFIENIEGR